MTTFNKWGQWSLTGDEDHLLFKTQEPKRDTGKTKVEPSDKIDINSEQATDAFNELAKGIVQGAQANGVRQATDEELFGHLVASKEQIDLAEKQWDQKIQGFYEAASQGVDKLNKSDHLDFEWENGKSFNDYLTEEQKKERNGIF